MRRPYSNSFYSGAPINCAGIVSQNKIMCPILSSWVSSVVTVYPTVTRIYYKQLGIILQA